MAYIKRIGKNTSDSHQTSPGYMLTFIRWNNRDTFHYSGDSLAVRKPLIVINDAIQVSVSNSKTSITPSLTAVLKAGDINYATAIAPGDYVFCNMKHWGQQIYNGNPAQGLYGRASGGRPINKQDDGFKGVYKVQTVRKNIAVDPQTGTKVLAYTIHAFGFTEFNTNIYYDPLVFNAFQGNYRMFNAQFNDFWSEIVSSKYPFSIQKIMQMLFQVLIGHGPKQLSTKLPNPANTHFKVPNSVGPLLGVKKAEYAYEIYNYLFGVWQPSINNNNLNISQGFNPSVVRENNPSFFRTPVELDGTRPLAAEFWNNVKIWSILQSYLNSLINEMYTTYRVNIDGYVMPTVVTRQKTFTSNHYRRGKPVGQSKSKVDEAKRKELSRHLEMPRWQIFPSIVTGIDLGRDEAARINYVQVYTRTIATNDQKNRAQQTALGNYVVDIDDIERNGLKPYIVTAQFDFPVGDDKDSIKGPEWSQLVGDFLIGGHLREAGTIQCIGIEEPISVGDKLQLGNTVYEIEGITHSMTVSAGGIKIFRTNLQVSFGMDQSSDKERPVYPEMEDTDSLSYREKDYKSDRYILPGVSDTQDIPIRENGEEIRNTPQESFTLNPKQQKLIQPSERDDGSTEDDAETYDYE